jgi:transcriptional regulator with XRE-family HTH domain
VSIGGTDAGRRRLGLALRELRHAADLTTTQLAERLGVAQSTISRWESGRQLLTPAQVNQWAAATGATAAQHSTLDEVAEQVMTEAVSWGARPRRLAALQRETGDLEESAGLLRTYHPVMIHGLLQVPDYARMVFQARAQLEGQSDAEVAEAVAARLGKQALLFKGGHRFEFLLTEAGLRWRFVPAEVMAAQLDRLRQVATRPNVTLGILPLEVETPVWRWESFAAFLERADDGEDLVHIENLMAAVTIRKPEDVARYSEAFRQLLGAAAVGDDALVLLDRIASERPETPPASQQPAENGSP